MNKSRKSRSALDRENDRRRNMRATDPEYRERVRKINSERYSLRPEYGERQNKQRREAYLSNPEYRSKQLSRDSVRKPRTKEQTDMRNLRARARRAGVTLAQFLTACPSGYAPRKKS